MTENTEPGRTRQRAAACAAAAALALCSPALTVPAAADPTGGPAPLPQVHPFKGADEACAGESGETVDQTPWTHSFLGLAGAHELSTGQGVEVALLATAADGGVPALSEAVEGGGSDCLGFGTFLAGVVSARPVEGSGLVGVAPGASLRVLPTGDAGTGLASAEEIADGIGRAVESGARVVLVGTGTWEDSPELEAAAAEAAEADVLVVAPATVATSQGLLPGYPAQEESVLSVASHDVDGAPVARAPVLLPSGDLARVDLTAPGDRVVGTAPGGGHAAASGDGVAAAFAAGSAALLMAREPELSAREVRERLVSTAYPSPLGAADPLRGGGRIDPLGAMAESGDGAAAGVPGEPFTAGPSPRGSLREVPTAAVVAGSVLLIVLCVLGGAAVRRGRARDRRPASPGEPVEG